MFSLNLICHITGNNYDFIPSSRGKQLLMYKGYTYSQSGESVIYYCSKKYSGCKARVKILYKELVDTYSKHTHEPPRYAYVKGNYIKLR